MAVNSYTSDNQTDVAAAISDGGEILVVWQSVGSSGADTDALAVLGQRYANDGSPEGGEFEVNTITTGYQALPQVAPLPMGQFIVVWESAALDGSPQGYISSIQGQRFAADGSHVASEFQISADPAGLKAASHVAANTLGQFSVVWTHTENVSGSPAAELRMQRFDATGTRIGGELRVDSLAGGEPERSRIAVDAAGGAVVTWRSQVSASDDSSSSSIQMRRFNSTGVAVGADMQVNTWTTGIQSRADVTVNSEGAVVVTWGSFGSFGDDTDESSVQARQFRIVGSVGGTVWLDDDNDGIFGSQETGSAGVQVELLDGKSVLLDTTATDPVGAYSFAGLEPVSTASPSRYLPGRSPSHPKISEPTTLSIAASTRQAGLPYSNSRSGDSSMSTQGCGEIRSFPTASRAATPHNGATLSHKSRRHTTAKSSFSVHWLVFRAAACGGRWFIRGYCHVAYTPPSFPIDSILPHLICHAHLAPIGDGAGSEKTIVGC